MRTRKKIYSKLGTLFYSERNETSDLTFLVRHCGVGATNQYARVPVWGPSSTSSLPASIDSFASSSGRIALPNPAKADDSACPALETVTCAATPSCKGRPQSIHLSGAPPCS